MCEYKLKAITYYIACFLAKTMARIMCEPFY